MSNNLSELLHKITFNTNQKIGSTTTVNQQVDEMEVNMYQFKRFYENQQKEQSQLQFKLKKFEQATRNNFSEMNKQLTQRIDYLTQLFKSDSEKQNGQFQYMEQQNKTLHEEHDKLNEIGANSDQRTETLQNSIGI